MLLKGLVSFKLMEKVVTNSQIQCFFPGTFWFSDFFTKKFIYRALEIWSCPLSLISFFFIYVSNIIIFTGKQSSQCSFWNIQGMTLPNYSKNIWRTYSTSSMIWILCSWYWIVIRCRQTQSMLNSNLILIPTKEWQLFTT